jgi:peptide/nickel transport system substrate-binding protein
MGEAIGASPFLFCVWYNFGMLFRRLLVLLTCFLLAACEPASETPAPPAGATPPAVSTAEPRPPTVTPKPAPSPTPRPVEGGTFTEGSLLDAKSLNSLYGLDPVSSRVISLLGSRLINVRPDLTPECDLCTSWTVSPDGLKVVFTLRQGVKFHDGQELTADDVKFTYDAILDPLRQSPLQSPLKNYLPGPAAIKVTGPYAIQFEFSRPKSDAMLTDFATPAILPKHLLGSVPARDFAAAPFSERPVYSGPFVFKEWVRGDHITLAANPDYYKGKPHLDTYVIKLYPELTSLFAPLRDGAIDAGTFDLSQVADAQKVPGLAAYAVPSFRFTYLAVQLEAARSAQFQDRRVRQALLYAVDRKALVDKVLYGQGAVAVTTLPPISWAFNPAAEPYAYSPERARALLEEAGWKAGADGIRAKDGAKFSFTLLTSAGNRIREGSILEIQRYWKAVGIDARVQTEEWTAFLKRIGATPDSPRDFDAFVATFLVGPDPNQRALWHSASAVTGYNYNGYKSADADKLIDDALGAFDLTTRKGTYFKLQQTLSNDLPALPLFYEYQPGAVTRRLHNFTPAFAGSLNNVQDWWLDPK